MNRSIAILPVLLAVLSLSCSLEANTTVFSKIARNMGRTYLKSKRRTYAGITKFLLRKKGLDPFWESSEDTLEKSFSTSKDVSIEKQIIELEKALSHLEVLFAKLRFGKKDIPVNGSLYGIVDEKIVSDVPDLIDVICESDVLEKIVNDDRYLKTLRDFITNRLFLVAKNNPGKKDKLLKLVDSCSPMLKQIILVKAGIDKEQGKTINKLIKGSGLKVTSQYLDEKIRVTGKKIDDLQKVYHMLKGHDDVKVDLQMENMK